MLKMKAKTIKEFLDVIKNNKNCTVVISRELNQEMGSMYMNPKIDFTHEQKELFFEIHKCFDVIRNNNITLVVEDE